MSRSKPSQVFRLGTVFNSRGNLKYQWLTCADEREMPRLLKLWLAMLGGPPLPLTPATVPRMAGQWDPPRLIAASPKHPIGDYPSFGSKPAFSQRAVDVLRDLLEPNGELLPLDCANGNYWAYNPTVLAYALDRDRSDLEWFRGERTFAQSARSFVFVPEQLEGLVIFRLPELPAWYFVTEVFRDRALSAGLKGIEFTEVWPRFTPDLPLHLMYGPKKSSPRR